MNLAIDGVLSFNSIDIIRVAEVRSSLSEIVINDFYTGKTIRYNNQEDLSKISEHDIILMRPHNFDFILAVYKHNRVRREEAVLIKPNSIEEKQSEPILGMDELGGSGSSIAGTGSGLLAGNQTESPDS